MESGLKQRITGALVLVVAAVIFLPMLLSGQDETERVVVDVPAEPVMDRSEMVAAQQPALPEPVPVPVPQIPEPEVEAPAVEAQPVAEPTSEPVAESAAPTVPPEPAAPADTATAAAPAAAGSWVVQQASFSSQSNAEGFRQTLAGQGYNAYVRSAQVDGKPIVRVYVGPVATRDAATRIRDELQRRHASKGMVVAYDDATRAP